MIGNCGAYQGKRISPMQLMILALLRRQPMYGYEILKRLRELFEGTWDPKTGSIYPAIKKLEEHGLIRSEAKDGKNYYSITEEGDAWAKEAIGTMHVDMVMSARWFIKMVQEASGDQYNEALEDKNEERFRELLRYRMQSSEKTPEERIAHLTRTRARMSKFIAVIDEELERAQREDQNK